MARRKTSPERVAVAAAVSRRLREIREDLYGEHGGPELARRLGLPVRTWYNYETGVSVPAEVLLGFVEQTGTNPIYLFTGEGERYLRPGAGLQAPTLSPVELIRNALERLENPAGDPAHGPAGGPPADHVALRVFPLERLAAGRLAASAGVDEIHVRRAWLGDPAQAVAVRVDDEAMHPVLPAGSIAVVDRAATDPRALEGKIVVARPEGTAMIRWLEVSGRHAILRPSLASREFPMIPFEMAPSGRSPILGQVVWAWSRLGGA